VIIGHRGASGLRPEHTLAAYELAVEQGADFVEPDLVPTRDGVLIARHENEIGGTTDVADHPEFASRRTTKIVSGTAVTGWFTEDFSWAELQTLRARERLPELRPASSGYDGQFGLMRLEEIIALTRRCSAELGRTAGVVAELKHAAYFAGLGLPLHELLGGVLAREKVDGDALYVESFEPGVLEQLRGHVPGKLVQLLEAHSAPADRPDLSYAQMATPDGLRHIADYAEAIGPAKALIVPRAPNGRSLAPTTLVADAHAAGLEVLAWTFRSENLFLPAELRRGTDLAAHGDAAAEYRRFYDLGVDAVFSDFPAEAVAAREAR
jgi:glycerophosphoryl diester phosphodiesterase